MKLEENTQYNFECNFEFPCEVQKILKCSAFLFEKHIYIVSFVDHQRLFKNIYDHTGELVRFENYRSDLITCSANTINELTEIYKIFLENINNLEQTQFDNNLVNIFNLITKHYMIDRAHIQYSFIEYEIKNQDKDNNHLYKRVSFYSSIAKEFTKYEDKKYLHLDLFRENNTYWYCIANSSGDKICKFIFEVEDLPTQYLFHLKHKENYHEKADLINFGNLIQDFKYLTSNSYEMHRDIPEENISWSMSEHFSYLDRVFSKEIKLSLFK